MASKEKGHKVFPIHQRIKKIEDLNVYSSLKEIPENIDTVSLYVAADISNALADDILGRFPRRIIFNPGAENSQLEQKAKSQGVIPLNACTLVMLRTGQF